MTSPSLENPSSCMKMSNLTQRHVDSSVAWIKMKPIWESPGALASDDYAFGLHEPMSHSQVNLQDESAPGSWLSLSPGTSERKMPRTQVEIPAKVQPALSRVTAAWHAINACQQGALQRKRAQQIADDILKDSMPKVTCHATASPRDGHHMFCKAEVPMRHEEEALASDMVAEEMRELCKGSGLERVTVQACDVKYSWRSWRLDYVVKN